MNYKPLMLMFIIVIATPSPLSSQAPTWDTSQGILQRIIPPIFPGKEFNILDYGAKGDGRTDCTEALAKAIAACNAAGGGKVIVPAGEFLTGAIHLKSNVNLFVSKNAVVKFSTDPKKYLPLVFTRWEGVEVWNYSALIYAYGEENVAVTGEGVLDGQGSEINWWPWKGNAKSGWKKGMANQTEGREKLFEMGEKGIPVAERIFGEGFYLRPNFFQSYRCKNVLVSGVTLKNSPMWFLNPTLCTNVTIEKVTVAGLGPNNDGCNPESCADVLIRDCYFNTGDDCIAIKSGRNNDGRRVNVPTQNVVIQNCKMNEGHGGVVIGSEMSGSVRNVFVEDCVMDSPNLDRALRFKTNSVRGGVIENFFARRITVGEVADAAILIDFNYEEGDAGKFAPIVRNLFVSELTCKKGKYAIFAKGYERSPIENLVLTNCTFDGIQEPNVIEAVKGLILKDVTVNGKHED